MITTDLPDEIILANLRAIADQGYVLLHFENANLENEIYRALAVDIKRVIGRGSFGQVYFAYPINTATGKLIQEKPLAVKAFKNISQIPKSEAKFFNAYYGSCEIISKDHDVYMVMNYIPGKNIMINKHKSLELDQEIRHFDFVQRADLVYNIMLAINIIHHYTPQTGHALIHGDINGSNIKYYYDPETNKIDVYIIDFGLSTETLDEPNRLQAANMEGTPLFMSKEIVVHDAHGIKSDIYALTPIFIAIFGGDKAFALKSQFSYYQTEYYRTPYDFTGMLDNIQIPPYPGDVKLYIKKFLTRMQDENFAKRPDSDEALKFFTTLQLLTKTYAAEPDRPDIVTAAAKLAVMADGIWRESVFYADLVKKPNLPAPEHFNFEDPERYCVANAIIAIAKSKKLDTPILQRIMTKDRGILTKTKARIFSKEDLRDCQRNASQDPTPNNAL